MTRSVKTEPGAKSPKAGQQQQQQRPGGGAGRAKKQYSTGPKFTGATEALSDVIFDIGRDSQSKWTNNHHELEEYALRGEAFGNPLIMARCIKDLSPYREKVPVMPDFDNMTQKEADGSDKLNEDGEAIKLSSTQLKVAMRLYEKEVEEVKKEYRSVMKDMTALYGQTLGQCTPSMRRSLEGHEDWPTIDSTKAPILLRKAIQSVMFGQQTHQYLPLTLHQSIRSIVNITQGKATPEDYHKRFVAVRLSARATFCPN